MPDGTGVQPPAPQQQVSATAAPPVAQPQMLAPPGTMPPHMMGYVSNPAALATAQQAAMFPQGGMMSPADAAMLGMPSMFTAHNIQQAPMTQNGQGQSVMVPRMATVMGSQAVANGFAGGIQQPVRQPQPGQVHQYPTKIAPNTASAPPIPNQNYSMQAPTTLGGIPIPALPPHSSTAMQVQVAAAAAAAAAAPLKSSQPVHGKAGKKDDKAGRAKKTDLTPEEKAKMNRDRNREHARSTRLRKKAYVQKLKELVEALHAERTEESRKRRVAVQHLSEVQGVRRAVVRSFLRFHTNYESDPRKWSTILEDNFWFKQPVTPFRSFRRTECEQECRISRGSEAMIADAASYSVMVEGIGSRSCRWSQVKRDEFLMNRDDIPGSSVLHNVENTSRMNHTMSSLSSSTGGSMSNGSSSTGSGGEEAKPATPNTDAAAANTANKVSSSSGSSNDSRQKKQHPSSSNDFHDYHAAALPDPMLGDSEEGSIPSDSNSGGAGAEGSKAISTDSSSGDEDKVAASEPSQKRRKMEPSTSTATPPTTERASLPANIAKTGGIAHNIRPVASATSRNTNSRLSVAPATPLPPFVGIGKKSGAPPKAATVNNPVAQNGQQATHTVSSASSTGVARVNHDLTEANVNGNGASLIAPDHGETSSNSSNNNTQQIRAYYHVNEDGMLLTEDILMCPFVFRSQDAVLCGALAECVMPGMIRAQFSARNKLVSLEIVYDSMGFMQQLERASGSDHLAQVVPGSLEMALAPNANEARVITLAKAPFLIVSVNEAWTRTTNYTQMEVEGRDLGILDGRHTNPDARTRSGKPVHKFEEVAKGRCACSTNMHYGKDGREFVGFVCSYPLTNDANVITHLLHVYKELKAPTPDEFDVHA